MFMSLALVMIGTFFFSSAGQALGIKYPGLDLLIDLLISIAIVLFILLFFLFPDGRFVPAWTRFYVASLAVYMLIASLFSDGMLFSSPDSLLAQGAYMLMLSGFIIGLFAQIYRYRRVSSQMQRQQTKWVVFGLGAAILVLFTWAFGFELSSLPPGTTRLYINLFGVAVIFLVLLLFPLSLAIAILRYRLWDIDVLVNRTLVYGALTGALALLYFGSVALLQSLFSAVSGQLSDLAIVISTLAIAALFTPMRRRVQDFIDRRFFRRKYDAGQTLASFAALARDEVELEQLTDALLAVAQETMQPAHVSLWLREPNQTSGT
jgi:hypothetical protein